MAEPPARRRESWARGIWEFLKGWPRTTGFAAFVVLGILVLTGAGLSLHYTPTPELAYDSVRTIERDVPWGGFVRAVHRWGGLFLVLLLGAHLLRVMVFRGYRTPHRLTWWTGLALLALAIAINESGQLLPWDEQGYYATEVRLSVLEDTPLVGSTAREIVAGSEGVTSTTLTRFYALHVAVLPLLVLGILGWHFLRLRRHGVGGTIAPAGEQGRRWFPGHLYKQAVVGLLAGGALAWWASKNPAPLEAMAVPGEGGFEAWPDPYMLWLHQLLRTLSGGWQIVATFLIPVLLGTWFVAVPLIDRRGGAFRWTLLVWGVTAAIGFLGYALTIAVLDERPENRAPLPMPAGLTDAERSGYVQLRLHKCMDCHQATLELEGGSAVYGTEDHDAPHLEDLLIESVEDFSYLIADPEQYVGEDTEMPSFEHVPHEQRRQIGLFLQHWLSLRDG